METSAVCEERIPSPSELRKRASYTTRSAGEALGMSHVRVSQIERHGTDSVATTQAMADLYGISFELMRRSLSSLKIVK